MKSIDSRQSSVPDAVPVYGESVNLDVLRSIAVLLVFGCHYFTILTGGGALWSVAWHVGQLGVLIFFVHTCLVLMWSLERSAQGARHLFAAFYVRRAMRIYPLSIVFVLLAYCFDARWSPVNLWQSLTLTQYVFFKGQVVFPPLVTPLWSLPLEIEMYVALPVLYLIFRKRSVLALVLAWVASVALAFFQPRLGEGFTILKFVPCFLGGVMAWRLMRTQDRRRIPGWVWPFAIALVSLIWMSSTEKTLPFSIAIFGMCLGLIIPLFREIRWPRLALAAKIVARYSYGIYLAHFPIMIYVMQSRHFYLDSQFKHIPLMPLIPHYARPIHTVMVVVLTAAASYVLYHTIEEPGIQLGRKLAKKVAGSTSKQPLPQPAKGTTESGVQVGR
jgi:peptidoglycan/LPS O-acetylase OafA/YrhL